MKLSELRQRYQQHPRVARSLSPDERLPQKLLMGFDLSSAKDDISSYVLVRVNADGAKEIIETGAITPAMHLSLKDKTLKTKISECVAHLEPSDLRLFRDEDSLYQDIVLLSAWLSGDIENSIADNVALYLEKRGVIDSYNWRPVTDYKLIAKRFGFNIICTPALRRCLNCTRASRYDRDCDCEPCKGFNDWRAIWESKITM